MKRRQHVMFSSFSPGWEELDLSSEGTPHGASQSGNRGGRGSNTSASRRDQGGEGGTGFRDRLSAVDGTSRKKYVA